ncbi:MAG: TIGR04219 family outer membrane beta-barrel protein [Plesiomonas sp.]|uniref:TIGR04219 family outer membrane beta-barrel protein n=1 Tax=Plesiomonas sp. TaxID=2486279 RepID=UPI003F2F0881
MKKSLALLTLFAASPAMADALSIKGSTEFLAGTTLDAGGGYRDSSASGYRIGLQLEHPIPLLPNAMIRYQNLDGSSNGQVIEQEKWDMIGYYQLLDNGLINIDIGAGWRQQTNTVSNHHVEKGMFLAYSAGELTIPSTPLSVTAELNMPFYDSTWGYDGQLGLAWNAGALSLKAGYQWTKMDFDEHSNASNMDTNGWYGGLSFGF